MSIRFTHMVDYSRYSRCYEARKGEHGKGSDMFGVKGDDIVLKMPVGTIVTDAQTGEVLPGLLLPGGQVLLAKGGMVVWQCITSRQSTVRPAKGNAGLAW